MEGDEFYSPVKINSVLTLGHLMWLCLLNII